MSLRDTIERASGLGIDAATEAPVVLRQLRIITLTSTLTALIALPLVLHAWRAGDAPNALMALLPVAATIGNLMLLKSRGSIDASRAGAVAVALTFALGMVANLDSTFAAPRLAWLYVTPLLAFLIMGQRGGTWWTLTVAISTVVFWKLAPTFRETGTPLALVERLVCLGGIATVGMLFTKMREHAETDVLEVHRTLSAEVETRRRAEESALAAVHAKTRFLGNMSHEIRTPMVGIMGMTDLLLATSMPHPQLNYAKTIKQSANNLLTIINDILDFVKIDEKKLKVERVPLTLRAVVEEAIELLVPLADERHLDLVTRFAPDTSEPILGDPTRIRQVLLNLIGNAIKFTETGHVLVKVEITVGGVPRRRVKFSVEDTGVGISPTKLARLFEPFTQADASTSRAYGGTGLGLAISKQLTSLMGGEIGVTSNAGMGSTFWFTVAGELAPALEGQSKRAAVLLDQRVVVASEHAYTREAARDLVRHLGARRVESLRDASEIPLVFEAPIPPDVVLIDVRMDRFSPKLYANARNARIILLAPIGHSIPDPAAHEPETEIVPIPLREKTLVAAITKSGDEDSPENTADAISAHILVVEDVEVNRTVIQALAEQIGCKVDLAANGVEAVKAVQQRTYDMILMDCHMPQMDGYAATRKIRSLGMNQTTLPIVALTANIMPGERERCAAAGMNDYMAKPVGRQELLTCLITWLQQSDEERDSGTAAEAPFGDSDGDDTDTKMTIATEPISPTPAPIFDVEGTLQRLDGNEKLLVRLVGLFRTESRDILLQIGETIQRRDVDGVREAAHKLKGALASIGGEAARRVAAQIETLATSGDINSAVRAVTSLQDEIDRLDDALAQFLASRAA